MRVHLPNSAFLGNIDAFLRDFDPSDRESLEITANKQWISIHPFVLSMVAALAQEVPRGGVRCEEFEARSTHYLQRMGLFGMCGIEPETRITEHDPSGRFVPLTRIRDSAGLTRFIQDMIPLLHLEPEQAEPIRYVVSELARNVLEHAAAPHGAILCAQYYRKSNAIKIGIADTGVGIRKTISASHAAAGDLDAIRLALMPGITGTTSREGGTELNAGAGLFFTKAIANVNRDFFVVYSGNAMFKLLKRPAAAKRISLHADPFADRHSAGEFPYWQGTAIGIDISLTATREFTEFLDIIRDVYTKAVRERRRERYKRPRFI